MSEFESTELTFSYMIVSTYATYFHEIVKMLIIVNNSLLAQIFKYRISEKW